MASRSISATNLTALQSAHVHEVWFVLIDLPSGISRLHTDLGDITADVGDGRGSQTWSGIGDIGAIKIGNEGVDIRPYGFRLTISGVKSGNISDALDLAYHGHEVAVYLGIIDNSTGALVDDPFNIKLGWIDTMSISLGPELGAIEVVAETRMTLFQEANGLLFNDEDQQRIHPGDLFFNHIHRMINKTILWGGRRVIWTGGVPRGGGGGPSPDSRRRTP